jgi:hypothetical protein
MSSEYTGPQVVPRTQLSFKRPSRQKVLYDNFNSVHEWTKEYSNAEFCNKWLQTGKMPIFYKLINEFLLLKQFGQDRNKNYFNTMVTEIIDCYNHTRDTSKHPITEENIINGLLENITYLYGELELFPFANTDLLPKTVTGDIVLYHGIDERSIIYEKLSQLQERAIYELPIFMSTSITLEVACKFTGTSKKIIRITISKADVPRFKYVYLGNTLVIGPTNFRTENEFLLNLFTKLECVKRPHIEEITFNIPLEANGSREITDTFTIIDMKFIGYSQYKVESLVYELKKRDEENELNRQGKKNKLNRQDEENELNRQGEENGLKKQRIGLGGSKKYKTNKRKYKTTRRKYKTTKRKIPIKKLSIKYKLKNQKMLTKSRKLYKKGTYYTRKNY